MNRLWVRLSLMIAGVLFFMFFLQYLAITLDQARGQSELGPGGPMGAPQAEIRGRLLEFMGLSILVGLGGGVLIGRVVSAPVSELVNAARQVGNGALGVRVKPRGSQELKELADSFNHMVADLERAGELRSNLMADVSHELRTPLTVLDGNLRAVLDHVYPLNDAGVANLYSQTRHLIRVVNDLRELSLAESKQLALEKQSTDLNTLIMETLQALEPVAAEKNIQLNNETTSLAEINADPVRIRQVLFNLLSNALRHTPPGGTITVSGEQSADTVTISVQDSGEGLEPEQIAAVFDRFYRGDRSRSRETGGTGLGLAIVKAIVEAHGGSVHAESEGKSRGSRFVVVLPG